MMKILQVNCVYSKGSTGKITYDLHHGLLEKNFESIVCYGRGKRINDDKVYKTCGEIYSKVNNVLSRITGLMYGECHFSTNKLIKIIRRENPDIVHLQCINGYFVNIYRLIAFLKANNIRTIVTLHAEFMYTANCGHAYDCEKWKNGCGNCPRWRKETKSILIDNTALSWKKMQKAFLGSEDTFLIVSVSPWLSERAKQSPMLSEHRHEVVFNGIDETVFKPNINEKLIYKHDLPGKKVILHVTARFADKNKGGEYVLKLSERLGDDFRILLIGKDLPEQGSVPENVICVGRIEDSKLLAEYYSLSDVTVITSKRETFSMVCAESLCCDTPVVGFYAGAPEQISLSQYSSFSQYGDLLQLEKNIRKWSERKKDGDCAKLACSLYGRQQMIARYLNLYEDLCGRM